ncbi:MAG TPA: glutamate--tRNA ligase [Verrucomicrobiae bacterium]|nr:glutamate--tRNA ligase [Verrucomicrobiae bacterium]
MSTPVRVRFAPSPTGYLHIGGLRSALYNWLFARKHGGVFALRIEDTDRSRYVEGAVESLQNALDRCGLKPDEGPYIQSERREQHLKYAYELIEKDHAYYCFCTKERLEEVAKMQQLNKQPVMYDRHCRNLSKQEAENRAAVGDEHVIRLKVPLEGVCKMTDLIRGEVDIPWAQVDDQVLIKSDGYPTYHLAATCDDHDMKISHVIRGEEWLSSLPKHLFIAECFGWTPPQYAHLPLLLNPDKSKLSKRQGDVAVEDYLAKGYLPEALINFVALMGWNPTADREIFTKEELAELFDITKVNKSGAVFNHEKLDWLNGEYIKALKVEDYLHRLQEGGFLPEGVEQERAARIIQDRLAKLSDAVGLINEVIELAPYDASQLVWKKSNADEAKSRLEGVKTFLEAKDENWFGHIAKMEEETRAWIAGNGWGNGDTLWPLRVALSGREKSPSPFELMFVRGKAATLARIDEALEKMA